jgi:hypothetical protein
MKRITTALILLAVGIMVASAQNPNNPCIGARTTTICVTDPSVTLGVAAPSTTTVCDGCPSMTVSTTKTITKGSARTDTSYDNCPTVTGTPYPVEPTIIKEWWVATGPGTFSATGNGLSATFTATGHGDGTVTFNCQWGSPTPCTAARTETASATYTVIGNDCPDPGAITPVVTVVNDAVPGAGASGLTTLSLADVTITACVYVDPDCNWRMRVQSAGQTIHWGISIAGYTEPILPPAPGANINCGNAIAAADDMAGYQARQGSGAWHMAAASTAHEMNHVNWLRDYALNRWANFESAIEAHVLGTCPAMTLAQANAAMATYIDQQRSAWFDQAAVPPEAPAYAAGQAVLNPMIDQIRAWHANNCP